MDPLIKEARARLKLQGDCCHLNVKGGTDLWAWRMHPCVQTAWQGSDSHATTGSTSTYSRPRSHWENKPMPHGVRIHCPALVHIQPALPYRCGEKLKARRGWESLADRVCAGSCLALHGDTLIEEWSHWHSPLMPALSPAHTDNCPGFCNSNPIDHSKGQ